MTMNELIDRIVFKVEQAIDRKLTQTERIYVDWSILTHKAVSEVLAEVQQEQRRKAVRETAEKVTERHNEALEKLDDDWDDPKHYEEPTE